MANLSKMVVDRQKSSDAVQAAGRTHRKTMADNFSETYDNSKLRGAVEVILDTMITDLELSTTVMV